MAKKQPAHEVEGWDQIDPYLYHGTDNETVKSIQREGMNTGESMEMSTTYEPTKRLWFGVNADLAAGFAGRRIHSLVTKEKWRRIEDKFGTDFGQDIQNVNPLEWEGPPGTPMPYEEFQSEEAHAYIEHIWDNELTGRETPLSDYSGMYPETAYSEIAYRHQVILRIKEADVPKTCEREEKGHYSTDPQKRPLYRILDGCDIPPEVLEFCNIGKYKWEAAERLREKGLDPRREESWAGEGPSDPHDT